MFIASEYAIINASINHVNFKAMKTINFFIDSITGLLTNSENYFSGENQ